MRDIIGAFGGRYFILGLKIRKHARYYRRVMGEKLTFGGKKSKTCSVLKARFKRKMFFRGGIFSICGTFSVQNYTFLSEFVAPFGIKI